MKPPQPHDDDRCARLYLACKHECVRFAHGLLVSSRRQNPYLCAFDAEELYDTAWETYYRRREYLDDRDDHIACINALIVSLFRDELRRSRTQKRRFPGRPVELDEADHGGGGGRPGTRRGLTPGTVSPARGPDEHLADRAELEGLLAGVKNTSDRRALVDHELRGLTYEEIGEREGISTEAARRRAERAKAQARHTQDEES